MVAARATPSRVRRTPGGSGWSCSGSVDDACADHLRAAASSGRPRTGSGRARARARARRRARLSAELYEQRRDVVLAALRVREADRLEHRVLDLEVEEVAHLVHVLDVAVEA